MPNVLALARLFVGLPKADIAPLEGVHLPLPPFPALLLPELLLVQFEVIDRAPGLMQSPALAADQFTAPAIEAQSEGNLANAMKAPALGT